MSLAYQPEQTVLPFRPAPPPPRNWNRAADSDLDFLEVFVGADRARTLLARFGSLAAVVGGDRVEIDRIAGPRAAILIDAVREVAVRMARADAYRRPCLKSTIAVRDYLNVVMAWEGREQFRVLFLDKRNKLIVDEVMGWGTISHAPVYPREVIRRALEVDASALILAHNHPAGDPTPSSADVDMTRMVIEAGRHLGIVVHDHIVIAREGHASLAALGLLFR